MDKDTLIILIVVAFALLVWVPAIIWSVRHVLRKDRHPLKLKNQDSNENKRQKDV